MAGKLVELPTSLAKLSLVHHCFSCPPAAAGLSLWPGLWTMCLGVWEGADLGSRGPSFQGTAYWNLDFGELCYSGYEAFLTHQPPQSPGFVYKCIR